MLDWYREENETPDGQWEITKDCVADADAKPGTNCNAIGMQGPRGFIDGVEMPYKFRMLDDDGEVYYYGICSEESFAPLDDFGTPNAGCARIEYKNKKGWFPI